MHMPSQNEHNAGQSLIGDGCTVFGLANSCTNGHTINVDIATNYMPEVGKEFEAWLVDDYYEGSGYALRMNKILESGTLGFHEIMTRAKTYTDIVIAQKPANDLSPLASWSNAVAQTWLIPRSVGDPKNRIFLKLSTSDSHDPPHLLEFEE